VYPFRSFADVARHVGLARLRPREHPAFPAVVLHRLLKFEHEIVDEHDRTVTREIAGVVRITPEIALGNEPKAGRFDFLARNALSSMRCKVLPTEVPCPAAAK
jgi:hypothetical protein